MRTGWAERVLLAVGVVLCSVQLCGWRGVCKISARERGAAFPGAAFTALVAVVAATLRTLKGGAAEA